MTAAQILALLDELLRITLRIEARLPNQQPVKEAA